MHAAEFDQPWDDDACTIARMERRRGMRVPQRRPVKLHVPAANRYIGAITADVSSSGLRLEVPRSALPLVDGRSILIHVADAGSPLGKRHQMIPARVVWTRSDDADCWAGVEFLTEASAGIEAA